MEDKTLPLGAYSAAIEHAIGPEAWTGGVAPFAEAVALCPIGVFDSGIGGLSIVCEIRRQLPSEDLLFYGDNANIPYGARSDEWLRARSLEIADFLLANGAKAIVVACNTASAAGLEHLRARHNVPIVGLVPAVKPAVAATKSKSIGVLATQGALRGRLLTDVIERFATPQGVTVVTMAEPGLVEAVERGDLGSADARQSVARALGPMKQRGVDTIVLGCTHYPFLADLITSVAGEGVQIIDSSQGVARQTRHVLEARGILRPQKGAKRGELTVYTSADPDKMRSLVWRLVGEEVEVLPGWTSGHQV
ncbi:MAG: glutamate racemase [Chloroflexota bacterium]|nr:glutamate racemase [Chloroflexota bacterium]